MHGMRRGVRGGRGLPLANFVWLVGFRDVISLGSVRGWAEVGAEATAGAGMRLEGEAPVPIAPWPQVPTQPGAHLDFEGDGRESVVARLPRVATAAIVGTDRCGLPRPRG